MPRAPAKPLTPDQRAKRTAYNRAYREAHREDIRAYHKARYRADPTFRKRVTENSSNWRQKKMKDPEYRARMRAQSEAYRCRVTPEVAEATRVANREKRRLSRTRELYGMPYPEFLARLDFQAGLCAVCCRPMSPGRGTQIDHCHRTNVVRALVCIFCNLLVGRLEGEFVQEAIVYVLTFGSIL